MVTAASGAYDLPIQPGTYDLIFAPPGPNSNLGPAIARSVTVESIQTVNTQLTTATQVFSGVVNDHDGDPIPNLGVTIGSNVSGQIYRAFTTSTGQFTITAPAGYYDFTNFGGLTKPVTLQGYVLSTPLIGGLDVANIFTHDLSSGAIAQNITINLSKLTLSLKDASGNPVPDISIRTLLVGGEQP